MKSSPTPWDPHLDDPTKRPEYEMLCGVIENLNPKFKRPGMSHDSEENRQMLKQLLRVAYTTNPYELSRMILGTKLRALSEDFAGPRDRGAFLDEAHHWCVLHLSNRYAGEDAERGDGQRKSNALSSNCIEWWDPAKGGVIEHLGNYFTRTLKPDFLEHLVEKRKKAGCEFYSIDHAKEMGMEPTVTRNGIEMGNTSGSTGSEDYDVDNAGFVEPDPAAKEKVASGELVESGDGVEPDEAGAAVNKIEEDENLPLHGEDTDHAESQEEVRPRSSERKPIALLTAFLARCAPELGEGIAKGDRTERIAGLKRACREIITRMGDPTSEELVADQRTDAESMIESVDDWDPRRVPWEAQFPEIIPYLQKESEVAIVRQKLEQEASNGGMGFLFPGWEMQDRLGLKPLDEKTTVDKWAPGRGARAELSPDEKLAHENEAMAEFLGIKLPPVTSNHKQADISRALANHWADAVLCPTLKTDPASAEVIESYRAQVKKTAKKWEFNEKHGMEGLLSRSLANLIDTRDLEHGEVQSTITQLGEHMQQASELRQWMPADGVPQPLKLTPSSRSEY